MARLVMLQESSLAGELYTRVNVYLSFYEKTNTPSLPNCPVRVLP